MNSLEICFSPELIHLHDLRGKAVVVVDIFRATSTMVTALANGVISIRPVEDLESCRSLQEKGYVTAGERNGHKAEGFELGNSPLSYLHNTYAGRRVAMTTTNGTVAIERSKGHADEILIGAFLNLNATATYLLEINKPVLILCAGWKGKFNLEDSLYAGALASLLQFSYDCDGTLAMETLYQHVQDDLSGFLKKASHAKRLQNYNIEADIDFCLTLDKYNLVCKQVGEEISAQKSPHHY
ncbi:2-phosphosulfolactate phosphatase [Lunatimonas salinarum]|uniref:2-phosphosulfolactate phosphatase n=1 Tax=Lunatimonas salinarum TaxID=1774590 RepID=UPI001ADFC6C9|nr:2-phosphosulfolactate phosphatase [Lunatimonas salinarum]